MKIIKAEITVRLEESDHELDVPAEIAKLLEQIGFDEPVNVTSYPDTDYVDGEVETVSFDPDDK
jgi:hypothetical protein